jgi:DNA end-binding protein Ku
MREAEQVALAQHVSRGKEHLVLIRPIDDGLALHQLRYADEIRPFADVDRGDDVQIKDAERDLARRLIDELVADGFDPTRYRDHYRDRMAEAVDQKVQGKETVVSDTGGATPQVIDLMEALKQSLAQERRGRRAPVAATTRRKTAAGKRSTKA